MKDRLQAVFYWPTDFAALTHSVVMPVWPLYSEPHFCQSCFLVKSHVLQKAAKAAFVLFLKWKPDDCIF